jgi:sigma-E factor negative regulatory protein RseA
LVVEGGLIRNARLDGYLRAHREALGSAPAALPGGAPRNVEMLLPVAPAIPSVIVPAAPSTASAR